MTYLLPLYRVNQPLPTSYLSSWLRYSGFYLLCHSIVTWRLEAEIVERMDAAISRQGRDKHVFYHEDQLGKPVVESWDCKNMVTSLTGLGTKNGYAGEGQQQFTRQCESVRVGG
jgi:hypothetical protein